MPQYVKTCNAPLIVSYKADVNSPMGHIEKLKIDTKQLAVDIDIEDLTDPGKKKTKAAMVLEFISWDTGKHDPISISGYVSVDNQQAINELVFGAMATVAIEIQFTVWDFDWKTTKYFKAFHSSAKEMKAKISKVSEELKISIADQPSDGITNAQKVFRLSLEFTPDITVQQTLELATSTNAKQTKTFGKV